MAGLDCRVVVANNEIEVVAMNPIDTKIWFDGKSPRTGNYKGKLKYLSE